MPFFFILIVYITSVYDRSSVRLDDLPRVVPCFPLLGLTPSGLFMGLK